MLELQGLNASWRLRCSSVTGVRVLVQVWAAVQHGLPEEDAVGGGAAQHGRHPAARQDSDLRVRVHHPQVFGPRLGGSHQPG